jgi:hypothetical protein
MFVPYRKYTYGPPRPVTGTVLLLLLLICDRDETVDLIQLHFRSPAGETDFPPAREKESRHCLWCVADLGESWGRTWGQRHLTALATVTCHKGHKQWSWRITVQGGREGGMNSNRVCRLILKSEMLLRKLHKSGLCGRLGRSARFH